MRSIVAVVLLTIVQAPSRNWRDVLVIHSEEVRPELLESLTRRRNATWLTASEATRDDLARGHVVLAGSPETNRFIRELAPDVLDPWIGPANIVQSVAPNPFNPDYRIELVIGNIDGPVGRRRANLHVRHDGRTVALGFEDVSGLLELRRFDLASAPTLEIDGFRFFDDGGGVERSALEPLVVPGAEADVHVYRSLEEKGLVTDDTRSAHVDAGGFHVVLGVDERPARLIAETLHRDEAPLLIRRGRAAVSMYTSQTLDRHDELASRILTTSDPPSLAELMDDAVFETMSPFITDAVSASVARFVDGRDVSSLDADVLDKEWARSLKNRTPIARDSPKLPDSFQRGVTYSHTGFQIHDGYLSERSDDSLAKLNAMGVDAVAVVPYAFMRAPDAIGALEVPTRAGSETDEDVVHVVRRARALGMTVMMKPQIWIRRSWPGDITLRSAVDEDVFFREYRRWILHYALMADAEAVPLLAIGTELKNVSVGYRERWEAIIDDIRCVYRGKLVYAANWGEEVLHVDFWDRLDYIGVDFYYPLSFDERPSDAELAKGFDSALEQVRGLHQRYRKPVLLTEIGYASTKGPWRKPHASDQEDDISVEDQARVYEIAFRALENETDWIRGMYWWKWPTNLERGGIDDRGFTPSGKPAEDVMRRWYGSRLQ